MRALDAGPKSRVNSCIGQDSDQLSPGFRAEDGRAGELLHQQRGWCMAHRPSGIVMLFALDSQCFSRGLATPKPEIQHLRSLGHEAFSHPSVSQPAVHSSLRSDTISYVEWSLYLNQCMGLG